MADFETDIGPGSLVVSGYYKQVITDDDVSLFGLGDDALKDAVNSNFGKRPNDAYLRSPTPWDDLYKSYGWEETHTQLQATSSAVTQDSCQSVSLTHQNFVNDTDDEITCTANMSIQKTNSASTSWSGTATIKVDQKITYKIDFGVKAGGETDLSFQYAFGKGGTNSESVTISSGTSVTVKVPAHSTKHAILKASQGHKVVSIQYEATLSGSTAVNYDPVYKDHHFWDLGIADVMSSGGISNSKTMTVEIALDYYSDYTVEVGDGTAPDS